MLRPGHGRPRSHFIPANYSSTTAQQLPKRSNWCSALSWFVSPAKKIAELLMSTREWTNQSQGLLPRADLL